VEGKLLACCASALRADILVAGHHGSKTSSRTAFLDKVGAYVFLVSAGPKRYATVTLPDAEVIDELETRGTVYRTDSDDPACLVDPAKIGPDNDNQPGGCDNVLVSIDAAGEIHAEYRRSAVCWRESHRRARATSSSAATARRTRSTVISPMS
jgi:competence protein ComEC